MCVQRVMDLVDSIEDDIEIKRLDADTVCASARAGPRPHARVRV